MSDDDEVYIKRTKTIHYGSLEDAEKIRLSSLDTNDAHTDDGPSAPPQIHTSTGKYIRQNLNRLSIRTRIEIIKNMCFRIYGA